MPEERKITLDQLHSIGGAIRQALGSADEYSVAEMPSAIASIGAGIRYDISYGMDRQTGKLYPVLMRCGESVVNEPSPWVEEYLIQQTVDLAALSTKTLSIPDITVSTDKGSFTYYPKWDETIAAYVYKSAANSTLTLGLVTSSSNLPYIGNDGKVTTDRVSSSPVYFHFELRQNDNITRQFQPNKVALYSEGLVVHYLGNNTTLYGFNGCASIDDISNIIFNTEDIKSAMDPERSIPANCTMDDISTMFGIIFAASDDRPAIRVR